MEFRKCLYFLLIFCAIFTDMVFSKWIGFFGRSLMNLLLPFIAIVYLCTYKGIYVNSFFKQLGRLTLLLVLVNVIADLIWVINGGAVFFHGENIFFKSFTQWLYWAEILVYMMLIFDCASYMEEEDVLRPFWITFIFLFLILVIEYPNLPNAFMNFHYVDVREVEYTRIRLTSTESSHTVPMIVVYGILSLYYNWHVRKNTFLSCLVLLMLGAFIITSGSKTIYFCISVFVITFVRSLRVKNSIQIFGYVIALIIAIIVVYMEAGKFLGIMTVHRGDTYTVRLLPIIASIITGVRYPFGLGGAVFYDKFNPILMAITNYFSSTGFGSIFRYDTLRSYNLDANVNTGVIAGYFNYFYQWGIVGGLYWIYAFVGLLRVKTIDMWKGRGLIVGGLNCVIFMIMFTMTFANHYMTWAYIIVASVLLRKYSEEFNL